MRQSSSEHGGRFEYCGHPSAPRGYGSVIDESVLFPSFCPGLKSSANITWHAPRAAGYPTDESKP